MEIRCNNKKKTKFLLIKKKKCFCFELKVVDIEITCVLMSLIHDWNFFKTSREIPVSCYQNVAKEEDEQTW